MAGDDDYFGYNIAALRQSSAEGMTVSPGVTQQAAEESWYSDRGIVSYDDVPDPEDNPNDIEYINAQIMGEQPGTAEYKAQQWAKVGQLLSTVQNQLRDQTKELADGWESPRAKEVFLDKVGETLAYLDVWHEAATNNSFALVVLAGIMREGQSEMRDLYAEYKDAMARSKTQEELGRAMLPPAGGGKSPAQQAREMHETGPPSTQSDPWRAEMREGMRTAAENKKNYDRWARELASRVAERYTPVIQRLETGRARKMVPLNAVNHPDAYGGPGTGTLPPPPAGPGPAPDGPGQAPGGPPAPPPPPPGPPPKGLDGKPSPDGKKAPDGSDLPKAPDPSDLPKAPDPTALPNPGPLPTVPMTPPLTVPTAPVPPGMPGLSPKTLTALNNTLSKLGAGPVSPTVPTTTSLSTSQTAQFAAKASSVPSGLYPPGTIPPPPGGLPNQPKQQGKVLGQRPGQAPPPGQAQPTANQARQRSTSSPTEVAEAFQPPPPTSAPVLDNRKGRRTRPGSAKEAPAEQQSGAPNATPPVLSNPRRGAGPTRTYSEERALRQRSRQQRPGQTPPELATGVPTGTEPVLGGRFAPAPESAPAPITLRGRAQVGPRDPHARPEVHADRTTRAPRQTEQVADQQSVWEVETPGGPVVASGKSEKQHRTEPPNALGAQ